MLYDTPSERLKKNLLEYESRQKELDYKMLAAEASVLTDAKMDLYLVRTEDFDIMSRGEKHILIKKAIKKITVRRDGYLEIETTYKDMVYKVGGATQI